ncbi:MAG: hypothetical protein HY835_06800 [Anaerolineae bacterium]|nr:hypothetical protein [Anaerolineae bacterium]
MNAEVFAEWLKRQGLRVEKTPSSWWYQAGPRTWQAFPFHRILTPKPGEVEGFLRRVGGIALRCSVPLSWPHGAVSYHVICDDLGYCLESLDRRTRQNVRAGLQKCQVDQISFQRLAEEGWELETETAQRQGRGLPYDRAGWDRRILAAEGLPGFEAWAALVDGRLAATILACESDQTGELIMQQCRQEFLDARVNHALCYMVTCAMLERGLRQVFYTLQSLDAPPSVDEFKFRMGYRAVALRQWVAVSPWARPLMGRSALAGVQWLERRFPANPRLPKMEGLIRFYQQGRQTLENQDWPACLQEARATAGTK